MGAWYTYNGMSCKDENEIHNGSRGYLTRPLQIIGINEQSNCIVIGAIGYSPTSQECLPESIAHWAAQWGGGMT